MGPWRAPWRTPWRGSGTAPGTDPGTISTSASPPSWRCWPSWKVPAPGPRGAREESGGERGAAPGGCGCGAGLLAAGSGGSGHEPEPGRLLLAVPEMCCHPQSLPDVGLGPQLRVAPLVAASPQPPRSALPRRLPVPACRPQNLPVPEQEAAAGGDGATRGGQPQEKKPGVRPAWVPAALPSPGASRDPQ